MLDDRERKLLFEIERRLLIEDPELVRSFGPAPHRRPPEHGRGTDMTTTVAGLTLCVVLLIGPRVLTEAEIATRSSDGPPRFRVAMPAAGPPISTSTGSRRYVR
ncbi:DUF3040 domain-containing protein [Pseudonocardia saturnea]